MANLRNDSEVERFLQPKIRIIVEEILKGIEEWNQKEIDRVVYAAGQPDVYQRTYEFRDAWEGRITKDTAHETEGEFTYMPNQMTTVEPGIHASVIVDYGYLDDIRPYLAEIIYDGLAGHIFGTGFWTGKRDAWERLVKIVGGSKMRTWINRGAKKAGLKISW